MKSPEKNSVFNRLDASCSEEFLLVKSESTSSVTKNDTAIIKHLALEDRKPCVNFTTEYILKVQKTMMLAPLEAFGGTSPENYSIC